jgi:hypothetical protein
MSISPKSSDKSVGGFFGNIVIPRDGDADP